MIHVRPTGRLAAAFIALCALLPSPALAQRQQPSPEQRLERLEKQLQQVQRQVFPKGRPADTAGFADDPAATQSSVVSLAQRLDSLERQMADLVRLSEENAGRLRTFESDIEGLRREQRERADALEQRIAAAAAAVASEPAAVASEPAAVPAPGPSTSSPRPTIQPSGSSEPSASPAEDAGEVAYTEGFRLWEGGRYDASINSLRAFVSAYPKHRRVSFANNLIGRALLDKGDARGAVQAFVANYRSNPGGERAPDSLYYLGQAFMKLGQAAQACNAYAELEEVYGSKIRPELKKLQTEAKQQAQCNS